MPVKFKNSININDQYTLPTQDGSNGQALITDGSGNISFGSTGVPAPLYIDYTNNRLGIGTSSPSAKLDIKGDGADFFLQSDDFKIARIQPRGTGANLDKGLFSLFNGNTESLRLDTDGNSWFNGGNVGIGTDNPGGKLDIKSAMGTSGQFNGAQLRLLSTDTVDTTGFQGIRFATSTADNYGWSIGANRSASGRGSIRVFEHINSATGVERFTIKQDGNVGIGTSNPSYRFAAYGSNTNSEIVASFGSGNDQNEYTAIGLSGYIAANGATKAGLALKRTSTYGTGELHFLNNNVADNSDMTLSDSKMMISSTGNVGIGTSSPATDLQINSADPTLTLTYNSSVNNANSGRILFGEGSTYNTSTNAHFEITYNGATNYLSFNSPIDSNDGLFTVGRSGNVGVGTTSPDGKLHIYEAASGQSTPNAAADTLILEGSSSAGVSILNSSTGVGSIFFGDNEDNFRGGFRYNHSNDSFDTYTNNALAITINSSRNVGIGTSNPVTKLQVGDGTTNDVARVYRSDGSYTEMHGYGLQFNRAASYIRPTGDNNKIMYFGTDGATWNNIIFDATEYDLQTNAVSRLSIDTSGNATFANNVTVTGNLTVNGTTTTLNTQTVEVEDNILQLNTTQGTPDTATAATSGISVYRGDGVTQASLIFDDSDDTWDLTNNLMIASKLSVGSSPMFTTGGSAILSVGGILSIGVSNVDMSYIRRQSTGVFQWQTYDNGNTGELHLQPYGGNVGIGTTSPSNLTHIYKNATIGGISSTTTSNAGLRIQDSASSMYFDGNSIVLDSTGYLTTTGNNDFFIGTNSVTRLFVKGDGKVGIGTASPAEKLTVSGNSNITGKLAVGSTAVHATYDFYNQNTSYFNGAVTVDSTFTQTGGGDSSFSGNLGIGTTAPSAKLEVSDNNTTKTAIHIDNTSTGGNRWDVASIGSGVSGRVGNLQIRNDSDSLNIVEITEGGNVGIGTTSPGSLLSIRTASSSGNEDFVTFSRGTSPETEVLKISRNAGDVRFLAEQNITLSADYNDDHGNVRSNIILKTNDVEAMRIDGNGKVGIGTSSPRGKLDIVGNTDDDNDFLTIQDNDTSAGSHRPSIRFRSDTAQIGQIVSLDNSMRFSVGTTEDSLLEIASSGNVGIGTTSPNYKLSVDDDSITSVPKTLLQFDSGVIDNGGGYDIDFRTSSNDLANRFVSRIRGIREGAGATSQLSFWTDDGSSLGQRMTINSAGNVGIGTSSPTGRLSVEGNITSSGHMAIKHSDVAQDIAVKVITKTAAHPEYGNGSSSGYTIDEIEGAYLEFTPGNTYKFDQSDSSNSGHPLRFYEDAAKNTAYTTGVTTNGTPGSSGAYTQIIPTISTPPVLFYQCSAHSLMGSYAKFGTGTIGDTYTINASTNGVNVNLNLDAASGTNSVLQLTPGQNIVLTRDNASQVTIDADDYDLGSVQDGSNVDLNLTSGTGSDNSTVQLNAGSNITLTSTNDVITIDAAAGLSGITVQEEGSSLSTLATTLNFVGDGVTATGTGGTKTITVTGGGGGGSSTFYKDTFSGNGSTTGFTLTNSVSNENLTQIYINGVYQSKDNYSVSGTGITFTTAPPAGTNNIEVISVGSVSVSDEGTLSRDSFTGDGTTTQFTLSAAPTSEDMTYVFIQGVYQEKSTYSLSGSALTFSTAPQNGYTFEVMSLTATNLSQTTYLANDNFTGTGSQTTFTLVNGTPTNKAFTMVFLSGVYQQKSTYSLTSGAIVFGTAPANNDTIEIVSIGNGGLIGTSINDANNAKYNVNVINSNTTASAGSVYVFTANLNLTLPANPTSGDSIKISNRSNVATCQLLRNGNRILGAASDLTLDTVGASFELIYSDTTNGWIIIGQ